LKKKSGREGKSDGCISVKGNRSGFMFEMIRSRLLT